MVDVSSRNALLQVIVNRPLSPREISVPQASNSGNVSLSVAAASAHRRGCIRPARSRVKCTPYGRRAPWRAAYSRRLPLLCPL